MVSLHCTINFHRPDFAGGESGEEKKRGGPLAGGGERKAEH